MKLNHLPIGMTDWSAVPVETQPGESGTAASRTRQLGEVRLRVVEYSRGYLADHWCHKGHVIFVVAGELVIEHLNGPAYPLQAGMSYHAGDGEDPPHRVRSESGARVFIVD